MRRPDARNHFPNLLEMRAHLQPPNDPAGQVALNVELRVYEDEIDQSDRIIKVQLLRLTLAVEADGFDPAPGPRFGEAEIQNAVKKKHVTTSEKGGSATLAAKLGAGVSSLLPVPKAEASAEARAAIQGKITEKVSFTETKVEQRVTARPGLRWEIREPDNSPLNVSYLRGEKLCSLLPKPGANHVAVKVHATAKQRDIRFVDEKPKRLFHSRSNTTQDKLLGIYLAKVLSGDPDYAGAVTLAQVEIAADD